LNSSSSSGSSFGLLLTSCFLAYVFFFCFSSSLLKELQSESFLCPLVAASLLTVTVIKGAGLVFEGVFFNVVYFPAGFCCVVLAVESSRSWVEADFFTD
jgi:hypothetical protein